MSKISEVVEILDSKRIPVSGKERETRAKIYPYYGAQGIVDYIDDYIFDGEYILVAEDGNNLKSLSENIATWATGKFWVNNHAHILGPKEGTNLKYIYYLLNSMDLRGYITGSAQPKFNQENLASIEINLPDKSTQDSVAYVLSLIDSNISNNASISSTLESLVKTLYDYWFVQFDFPDENGKPYKSSGGKMVWNEELKREIPEGWEVKPVRNVAELYQPKTISENELLRNGKYYVYGANGIVGRYDKYNHSENEVAICCRGASCGQFIMTQPFSWITGNAMVVTPKSDSISKEYLYYGLSVSIISKYITGSAQPQITRSNLELMTIVIPEDSLLRRFDQKATIIRTEIQRLFSENEKLISLRDFLLPMLMNGQVKVMS